MSKLKQGDALPDFSLKNQDDEIEHSQDWLGAPVVIYFYPGDYTPICTAQACSFRNQHDEFKHLNARVIGISKDSVKTHKRFSKQYKLPFSLLSDSKGEIAKLFGATKGLFGVLGGRITYVFDGEGVLKHIHNGDFNASKHIKEALKVLR